MEAEQFTALAENHPVVDVRSPSEFSHGHYPGATNIPLFNDEERARVGILYKNKGREVAVEEGLRIAGPKLTEYVSLGKAVSGGRDLLMYCWRGGMRSGAMAWLFRTAGIPVILLEGGYKAYRRFLKSRLEFPREMRILGGMTGSGKTRILHELKKLGEQVIDLEAVARHRGSVFGSLKSKPQPTTEQFENNLFAEWLQLKPNSYVWLEDESKSIGRVFIPDELFVSMKSSLLVEIHVPREKRIINLVEEYGKEEQSTLIDNVSRITKRLGSLKTKEIIEALKCNDYVKAADLLLNYYDKAYRLSMSRNKRAVVHIDLKGDTPEEHAREILSFFRRSEYRSPSQPPRG